MTIDQHAAPWRQFGVVGGTIARVLRELEAEPGSTVIDLADAVGVSPSAAYMALYRAKRSGVPIEAQRSPRGRGAPLCYRLKVRGGEIGGVSLRILSAMDSEHELGRRWTVRELAAVVGVKMRAAEQSLRVVLMPRGDVRRQRVRQGRARWVYFLTEPSGEKGATTGGDS